MDVTYKDLKDGYILKDGDKIVIHGAKHRARITDVRKEYYLEYNGVSNNSLEGDRIPTSESNNFIFLLLHISDKNSFVKDIAGKDFSGIGCFPQVKTLEALTKVAIALLEKPLYNVGDYVTVRKEIEGHKYALTYWDTMQEFAGKTSYVTKFEIADSFDNITDGEIYQYKLSCGYWWDFAMLMPATVEEKRIAGSLDKKEPEEKEEEKIHFVTLEDLNSGYIFKESDYIYINGMECVIRPNTDNTRFWLSSDTTLEYKIYESLEIPGGKKDELAKLCGATDLSFHSPEFDNLENLSNFVRRILMYKKEDEKSSEKKWSGNPTYFDLKDGRILKQDDILNIHGIEYRVTSGASAGTRCWLHAPGFSNSAIFDKLRIEDKCAFIRGICPLVNYGDFPEVCSFEDLTKVAIALYEVPEFKVGDKVKVAHREDDEEDYPELFVDDMAELEGKEYTITGVNGATYYPSTSDKAKERLNEDPNLYDLDDEGSGYWWHSSMLEKVSESDKKSEESSKEETSVKSWRVNLSALQSGYTLKTGDTVVLCEETYKVYGSGSYFLCNVSGGPNHSVFDKLSIKDKMNFCSLYGSVSLGDFPEFNRIDALTACVKQLMLLEEQYSCCKGDCDDTPMFEAIKFKSFDFTMDIIEPDKPSDTGNVRLPEIKDDFKIIL